MHPQIATLEALLRRVRPDVYANLQPGVNEELLSAIERCLGLELPTLFKELYRWRNGQPPDDFSAWQNNQTLLSLDDIAESHQVLSELLEAGEFDRANWWSVRWVPFLHNGAGDYLCLDTEGSFTGRKGQIIQFWHDDPTRWVVAPSFEAYLDSYLRMLERAAAQAVTHGELDLYWENDIPGYPVRYQAGNA
jgi:cell wall assembly regulator SMI1